MTDEARVYCEDCEHQLPPRWYDPVRFIREGKAGRYDRCNAFAASWAAKTFFVRRSMEHLERNLCMSQNPAGKCGEFRAKGGGDAGTV